MTIGERLKELRKQKGITLAELSKRTDLSVSFLSDIERGRTNPSLDALRKLAYTYQLTLSELFKGVV